MIETRPSRLYKDSGIAWLGTVPESWAISPLIGHATESKRSNTGLREKNLLSLSYGRIVPKDINSSDGLLPDSFESYQVVEPNSIVLRLTDLQNDQRSLRTGLVTERGIITSAYLAIDPIDVEPRYLAYYLRDVDSRKVFYSLGGGLRQSMQFADLKRLPILIPSRAEQTAIANFLDRETAEIDAFIADQEELIRLLTERRAATISHAVTKGLDPGALRKWSGVKWLGDVPAHWRTGRIRYAFELTLGKMVNASSSAGQPRPYVRAANIQEAGLDLEDVKHIPASAAELSQLSLRKGDVLVVEGGAGYGRSAILNEDLKGWIFQNHVIRARPIGRHEPRFFDYFVKNLRASGHFEALGTYATIPNVSAEKLGGIEYPYVPLDEQRAISDFLDDTLREVDAVISEAREAIALSRERRAALISAAVAGKIDVREHEESTA